MAFKVSGDFAKKFDRWQELLNSASVIVRHTSEAQAEVALTLIGEGFDNEADPYGRGWESKQVDDGRKILHGETTRLRNGWHVAKATDGGWQVDPGVEYAAYHQEPRGDSRPTRRMVPDASLGLPKEWAEEFEAVAIAEAMEHFDEAADGPKPRVKKRTSNKAFSSIEPANDRGTRRRTRGGSLGSMIRTLRRIRSLARRSGVL